MRILLVSYYFPPFNSVGAVRPGKLAKHLYDAGHDVHVLTCSNQPYPPELALEIPAARVTATPAWSINAPVDWLRGGSARVAREGYAAGLGAHSLLARAGAAYKTLLHWPDGQLGWAGSALRAGLQLLRDGQWDLIYVSAPPFTGLRIGARLSRASGVPCVAEIRDLWTDNHADDQPAWRRAIERLWERRLLRNASALVSVSAPLVARLARFRRPAWVVRNGYCPEDFSDLPRPADYAVTPDVLTLAFTGNIYPGHYDVDSFCAGLATFRDQGGAVCVHVVGRNTGALQSAAQTHGVSDLFRFRPSVPHREAMALQRHADVLVTFLWDGGQPGKGVYTAKLFEYAGAGRPVLAVGQGISDTAELLTAAGLGVAHPDAAGIAAQLQRWQAEKRQAGVLQVTPRPGHDFTRATQFRYLEAQLQTLLAARGRRVCFVCASAFAMNAFLATPIAALQARGWQVSVVANPTEGQVSAAIGAVATVHDVALQRAIRPLADARALWHLWRLFRTEQYDVVHSITPKSGLLAMLAARLAGVPQRLHTFTGQVWITRRGPLRWLLRALDRLIARCATVTLVDSPSQRAVLADHGIAAAERLRVLGAGSICGVDTARFKPDGSARAAVRARLGIAADATVVLYAGRLQADKGITELLAAFATLAASRPGLHLIIAGPDEGMGPLVQAAQAHPGHGARIHAIGLTAEPEHYMAAADIFCLPSYREGFGLTLIEAAACGLPTVATRIYGITDAVVDDVTGLLVTPRDATALAAALARVCDDPAWRQRLGRAGRERVQAEFASAVILDQWLRFYAGLQAAPPTGKPPAGAC